MKLIDARSGKVVRIGETVRYPRTIYREDGSSYEGSNEDWTLIDVGSVIVSISAPGFEPLSEDDYVNVRYREDATGIIHSTSAPVRGWWIWKYAVMPT